MGQLTLDCEQIGCGAIVSFGPDMRVGARVDQFRVDAKTIRDASHRTFHDVSDAELPADFAHVAFGARLVLAHTGVADHLQVRKLREIGEDLVLHAVGEVGVAFVFAQVPEWQHGDRFPVARR